MFSIQKRLYPENHQVHFQSRFQGKKFEAVGIIYRTESSLSHETLVTGCECFPLEGNLFRIFMAGFIRPIMMIDWISRKTPDPPWS